MLQDRSEWTREGGLPLHIPYLKKLGDQGDDPDPADPFHHSSKGVWTFEPVRRTMASIVKYVLTLEP